MTSETTSLEQDKGQDRKIVYRSAAGASAPVYGFGLIGAWIYYFSHAPTLADGVLGFFKGLFWPAVLVYELLKFLKL